MKKLLFVFPVLFLLLICSCSQKTAEKKTQTNVDLKTTIINDSLIKIISEKERFMPNLNVSICNLAVELKFKPSRDDLKEIANKLHMTRLKYDKLWIVYYLSSVRDKSIAWASTNFTPNLEIDISGSSDIEIHKMNSVIVDGNLIGKWQDGRPLSECGIILFEKNKKIFMKRSFGDGSSGDDEFTKKVYRGKIRYQSIQDTHNEYYLIENNGNLGMYGENGKIGEAIIK